MTRVILGTAPDSWGVWFPSDARQTPWTRFLDEVATAGYTWIELGPHGYLPTDSAVLQSELGRRALRVAGTAVVYAFEAHDAWSRWGAEVDRTCALLSSLEAQYLILIDDLYTDLASGASRRSAELEEAEWRRLIDTTARIADVAERYSLRPVLHPHADTHIEFEPQIERFMAEADQRIGICLDVGHHAYAGADPIAFFRRHHRRIPYLHLKNIDAEMRRHVRDEGIPFAVAVGSGMFVEPQKGAVDFVALRNALDEVGFDGFGIVEQDMYPAPFDLPLPIAKRTREYLLELGFGQ